MATDQEIRDAGFKYIPQQKYLQNPFQLPTPPEAPVVNQGIVNTNAFNSSGGGGSIPTNQLMFDFNEALAARQNKLENPGKFAQFLQKFGIGNQRSVDQMMRDATAYNMAELGPSFKQMPINNNMTGPEIQNAMAEYGADETSIGNYPVDDPRDVRTDLPLGISPLISRFLPSSYHDKMTMPEQIYTQSRMGYTGPTIFGENASGLNKDIFGRNVISGFGNYAKKQAKDIQKLDDLFESQSFIDKYGDVTFEEDEEGIFSFKGVPEHLKGTKADPNYMHKLNLIRYNYDKKGLKDLENIKDETGFTDIMQAENKGTTDYGITSGISDDSYRSASETRRRSDQQDAGFAPDSGGSTFDYSDPYDPGGGE